MRYQHQLRYGTINCQTLKNDIKLAQAIKTAKTLNHNLTFVQESHRIGCNQINFEKELAEWKYVNCGLKSKHAKVLG